MRVWETAGDENLGFWFVSKCLTQMDMAFQTGGQTQLLIKTNTKQHGDSSEEGRKRGSDDQAEGRALSPLCHMGMSGEGQDTSRRRS